MQLLLLPQCFFVKVKMHPFNYRNFPLYVKTCSKCCICHMRGKGSGEALTMPSSANRDMLHNNYLTALTPCGDRLPSKGPVPSPPYVCCNNMFDSAISSHTFTFLFFLSLITECVSFSVYPLS